jgi:uncharacterized protein
MTPAGQQLLNQTKNKHLATELAVATNFMARTKGLLGKRGLPVGQGLWIHACPSIHTFFMKFPIDAVFVDEKLIVRSVHFNVRPWRIAIGAMGSSSVFELPAGTMTPQLVEPGDQLYVGH